jgi:hypothetical protein
MWANFRFSSLKANTLISIDVIIPIVEKDLKILPLCLEGLKKNVANIIKEIYIVAPNFDQIRNYAESNNLIFIDENSIFGYSPKDINYMTTSGLDRSGWIFQQLIKLSGNIGNSRFFLVIDADHILLRPHTFITHDNLMVFYLSSEFHFPYYKMIYKLLKVISFPLFSYVSHKMIFDKEELMKLHLSLERCSSNKINWDRIILSSLDVNELSCFSEYELYGSYVNNRRKILLPWKQKALNRNKLDSYEVLKNSYSKYWSVTLPSYLS